MAPCPSPATTHPGLPRLMKVTCPYNARCWNSLWSGRVANQIASSRASVWNWPQLQPLDLEIDRDMIGSNARIWQRADRKRSWRADGKSALPWQGSSRFHMAHLTYPGEIDVMGVGLISTARMPLVLQTCSLVSHGIHCAAIHYVPSGPCTG